MAMIMRPAPPSSSTDAGGTALCRSAHELLLLLQVLRQLLPLPARGEGVHVQIRAPAGVDGGNHDSPAVPTHTGVVPLSRIRRGIPQRLRNAMGSSWSSRNSQRK